jgi:dimethylaniline monooxygenase (N-oxide forming)
MRFVLQSHKAMPYINRPYRNRPAFMDYFSKYVDPPEDSPPQTDFTVDLAPFPTHFTEEGRAVFPLAKRNDGSIRKDALRMAGRDFRPDTVRYASRHCCCATLMFPLIGYLRHRVYSEVRFL